MNITICNLTIHMLQTFLGIQTRMKWEFAVLGCKIATKGVDTPNASAQITTTNFSYFNPLLSRVY